VPSHSLTPISYFRRETKHTNIKQMTKLASKSVFLLIAFLVVGTSLFAQNILYTMPEESAPHEGTWLQWPHNYLYGPWYRQDVEPTWVAMTDALQDGERVHIIAHDSTELAHIKNVLSQASVPMHNIDFFIFQTDDVWVRDNGPIFVYDQNNNLTVLDWGFNGWGSDAPFSKCDSIPPQVSQALSLTVVDLNAMVLEGGGH
jgi:agmatine deiminase